MINKKFNLEKEYSFWKNFKKDIQEFCIFDKKY